LKFPAEWANFGFPMRALFVLTAFFGLTSATLGVLAVLTWRSAETGARDQAARVVAPIAVAAALTAGIFAICVLLDLWALSLHDAAAMGGD
jgi:hypothetical protein